MKKSVIAVLSALGFIVLCMIVMMILGRAALGPAADWSGAPGATRRHGDGPVVSETLDLAGFDGIVVEGAWEIRVYRSEEFSLEIEYPDWYRDNLKVEVRGGSLVLGCRSGSRDCDDSLHADIAMPSLELLRIEGAADVIFEDFEETSMEVAIDGAGRIKARDCRAERLAVSLQGLGQVDLDDLTAVDASVVLEGAGEIRVRMDGGVLDGRLDGLGSIKYSGEVSRQDVRVDGMGSVKRID